MPGIDLASLTRCLRWQDAVDVLLLTLIISSMYRWIRRTVAVQVALGLVVLLAGSWTANHLGLILTSYLLSAIGAVATIAFVVLFQSEIRRALGRVSPSRWSSRQRGKVTPLDSSSTIAAAAFSLANRSKGALIVVPRRDPVFDHVTAGTIVEARLSEPLLEAIFTSTSPLHDGAVVVGDGRVLRAGVVLPLATESADPTHGTRHRAALGLARATDALIVCVSEERGSVCLAHDDALDSMADVAQLASALRGLGAGGPRRERDGLSARTFRLTSVLPHLAIFAGVVTAWAVLALDRSHATTRIVPLEFHGIRDGIAFDPPRQTSISVELRSSRRELEVLPPAAVEAYVELAGATLGSHTYRVHTSAPAGIEVAGYAPTTVLLRIRPRGAPVPPAIRHEEPAAPELQERVPSAAPSQPSRAPKGRHRSDTR